MQDPGAVHELHVLDDVVLVGAFGHNEELQVVRHEVVAFHADRCRQFSIPLLQEESFQSLEIQGAFVVRYDIQQLHCLLDAVCEFHFGREVTQPHTARFLMHHHRLLQLEHLHALRAGCGLLERATPVKIGGVHALSERLRSVRSLACHC